MRLFRLKVHPELQEKTQEAEELKASIIESPKKVEKEVEKLNRLIRSSPGFSLKILVGIGHHD